MTATSGDIQRPVVGRCPTCGCQCEIVSSDEGTNYFRWETTPAQAAENEHLREALGHVANFSLTALSRTEQDDRV